MRSRLEETIEIPRNFRFGGIASGIKESGRLDLSVICSDSHLISAGVYTQNIIHAASIDWCRSITPSDDLRAVTINSGNANACTGEEGERNNRELAELTGQSIGCRPEQVLVLSTGIIGHQLPMDKIRGGMKQFPEQLGQSKKDLIAFSTGMTTTDQFLKVRSTSWQDQGETYHLCVVAKGAGMIGPNMATMLAVAFTDFPLDSQQAQNSLQKAVNESFNCIRVDGHTSTNDAVLLLSSGKNEPGNLNFEAFQNQLNKQMIDCAKLIPEDGEGATKVMQLTVNGCTDRQSARQIAFSVADSPLVKTALFGCDPNWGRIVSAAGYSGIDFDPKNVQLSIEGTTIYQNGVPLKFNESDLSETMQRNKEIQVNLAVGNGPGAASVWSSDLTTEYVKFNSDYST